MQTVRLDENNNIVIYQGNIQVIDGVNALAQDIKTQVGLCARENPFDLNEGIDYDNEVLGRLGGLNYIKDIIRQRVLSTNDEVINVENVEVTYEDRGLKIDTRVSSIYGEVVL